MANNDSTVPETKTSRIDQCRSSNIMIKLWERTSHTLTKKELEWFSAATEHAEHMIISLHDTIEGVGCLVSGDGWDGSVRSGNFQSHNDVPELLYSIANSLDTIQGLIHIGSSADHRLKYPELYRESDAIKAVK
ncbi:hypothetical protein [Nitrosomonas sp. Nm166]|uniref:hypothetical protein n=1 Tax=Nitrosomonas sp. Nm166 TaxID=1881054 RepID=UPI0008E4EF82|nr:hypothetical protein [Nitrosomonas sp. Nm166]SFF19550.1 hypothetical protein SAMN05428977_10683 [Nitrosomonas sp. Nm166]